MVTSKVLKLIHNLIFTNFSSNYENKYGTVPEHSFLCVFKFEREREKKFSHHHVTDLVTVHIQAVVSPLLPDTL